MRLTATFPGLLSGRTRAQELTGQYFFEKGKATQGPWTWAVADRWERPGLRKAGYEGEPETCDIILPGSPTLSETLSGATPCLELRQSSFP
jgi:hypothetical protein